MFRWFGGDTPRVRGNPRGRAHARGVMRRSARPSTRATSSADAATDSGRVRRHERCGSSSDRRRGLGIMGAGIARNFLTKGYPLSVWNRTRRTAEPFARDGAHIAATPRELAERSDVIITCLSSPNVVGAVAAPGTRAALGRAQGPPLDRHEHHRTTHRARHGRGREEVRGGVPRSARDGVEAGRARRDPRGDDGRSARASRGAAAGDRSLRRR